jgi:hypothetical protein
MTQQLAAESVTNARSIERIIGGQFVMDGAGVKINRILTQPLQRRLDPFLMLDAFGSDKPGDYIAGFPEHPHRGFETVTYMLTGRMRHRDSAGNEGLITNGGVQWMTAGRGVAHAGAGGRTDGRLPAVAQPARPRQDVRTVVSRHPDRSGAEVRGRRRRHGAGHCRHQPWG